MESICFVAASHKENILNDHLLKSPCLKRHRLILAKNYKNVSMAYKKAMKHVTEDIICLVHHDVRYPLNWDEKLLDIIKDIEKTDKEWGCLGLAGTSWEAKQVFKGNIRMFGKKWMKGDMNNFNHKKSFDTIETLDELCIIMRREVANKIKWDKKLDFHYYGPCISLQCKLMGLNNYVINNYAHHASDTNSDAYFNGSNWIDKNFQRLGIYMSKKYPFTWCGTCSIVNQHLNLPFKDYIK